MRGTGIDPSSILYGEFEMPSDRQAAASKQAKDSYRKELAETARKEQKREAILLQRQTPIQADQFQEIVKSRAEHPMLARRYGLAPEDIKRFVDQALKEKLSNAQHLAYVKCLHYLYPPGTRVFFRNFHNPGSPAVDLPFLPSPGDAGVLAEYSSGSARFNVSWDNGQSCGLMPKDDLLLFADHPKFTPCKYF